MTEEEIIEKIAPLLAGVAAGAARAVGGAAGGLGSAVGRGVISGTGRAAGAALANGEEEDVEVKNAAANSKEVPLDKLTDGKLEEVEKEPAPSHRNLRDEGNAILDGKIGDTKVGTPPKQSKFSIDTAEELKAYEVFLEKKKVPKGRTIMPSEGRHMVEGEKPTQTAMDNPEWQGEKTTNLFGKPQVKPKKAAYEEFLDKTLNQYSSQDQKPRGDKENNVDAMGESKFPMTEKPVTNPQKVTTNPASATTQGGVTKKPAGDRGATTGNQSLGVGSGHNYSDSQFKKLLYEMTGAGGGKGQNDTPENKPVNSKEMGNWKKRVISEGGKVHGNAKKEPPKSTGGSPFRNLSAMKAYEVFLMKEYEIFLEVKSHGMGDARYGNVHETGMEEDWGKGNREEQTYIVSNDKKGKKENDSKHE